MDKILKGEAYDLARLISIEGYHGFILESGKYRSECEEQKYEEPCLCDLGMRRILEIYRSEVYLILVGEGEVLIWELEPAGCKISDFLRKRGYKCRMIAEYERYRGKSGILGVFAAWELALKRREAVFSKNGYALQYSGWADYKFYQFEFTILQKGWIVVDGYDIESFQMWNVQQDIMDRIKILIEKALCKPQVLTGTMLADLMKNAGLAEEIPYLRIIERDDEQSSKC